MNNELSEKIFTLIIEKFPNMVSQTIITLRLKDFPEKDIIENLDQLVDLGQLIKTEDVIKSGEHLETYYSLPDVAQYPFKKFIQFGERRIPRVIKQGSIKFFPENFNEAIEILAIHGESLREDYEEKLKKLNSDFWSKIFTTFATFTAILALILTGIPKIAIKPEWTYKEVFLFNLSQLLPIFIFSFLLIWLARNLTK